ncbi:bestrophin-like domain [Cupriavidus plantarum]|uniref:bestrophin-like domain n=1 Tax=Cupriavidus plantarum TaxID=942865 RepID=UPI00339D6403
MDQIIRHPAVLFVLLLILLMAATAIGAQGLRRYRPIRSEGRDDFSIIQGATLTLLALLIGFTLSMAVSRYDQRKNLEEEEANAIGTELLRAELLEAADVDKVKALLVRYLAQRVTYYETRDRERLREIEAATAAIEDALWKTVRDAARDKPNPITALVAAGMNDVINSQGYADAAWRNRIPVAAWCLMIIIAFFSTLMQGYGARTEASRAFLLLVLPLTVSLSLALIADIDSPRGGLIRVKPQNLHSLQASLPP